MLHIKYKSNVENESMVIENLKSMLQVLKTCECKPCASSKAMQKTPLMTTRYPKISS